MKRFLAVALVLCMMLPFCFVKTEAETYIPSRTINLVYDDSGSMVREDGVYFDTWCQAKYAMEVFAGMLGENESLNIYYMSDYDGKNGDGDPWTTPPRLRLKGSKNAKVTESNVQKIHDLITRPGNTPFTAVEKAYNDLKSVTDDERWLVVLTDGVFGDKSNEGVEEYFNQVVRDGKTRVMMLSMGSMGAEITPSPEKNIFFEKAETTEEIPAKLTGICNRIFQSNALSMQGNKISFNVPMSQLVVFAQGKDVRIDGLTDANGKTIQATANVPVRHSTEPTIPEDDRYPEDLIVIADNLNGFVATFDIDFAPGTYTVNVSGAADIQVYYKPNVSIAAYLYNQDDVEVTAEDNLIGGTYRVEFGFIDATTGARLTDTSLLGEIIYNSKIVNTDNDGEKKEMTAQSGDTITITEGRLDIAVTAQFLEYNTVHANLSYTVYESKSLIFTFDQKPTYNLNKDGFENPNDPMILSVMIAGKKGPEPLTPQQWELLGIPSVTTTGEMGAFRVEKTDEIGKFRVYPTLKDGDPMATDGGEVPISVEAHFKEELSSVSGMLNDSFHVNNSITFTERLLKWLEENWLELTIWILIILLILGYIPPFKKYLPRKLKARPYIKCKSLVVGIKDKEAKGKYKRNLVATLIPYKAETGKIIFCPAPHKKVATIKAAGGKGILVTNVKSFAGKSEFLFDGTPIDKERKKPYPISAGSNLSRNTSTWKYTCYLNQ